ncbi:MAG: putative Aurora kinase C [Streblomastix strix]|uniref:Putative Aurora kinase C n=1 Tax=Streblomastix strix TaxID=222440 RepID=A0A5J4TSU0_9EUKA|nr:MAG: putative Aurora kinase C [Streblomastix strix]
MEYSNMKTLDIIAKQKQILLPSCTLRALIKQILDGMRAFHSADLVHRDIKCDNILLHSPPGSGRVYAKISDFGFAKKVDLNKEQTYLAGTLPFMSPEQFHKNPIITQKVDIYSLGITFYKLITHKYPVNERNFKEQGKKMIQLKSIERPSQIKDNLLWDLLQNLLEFDPDKRITAAEALQHPYFTSPEAIADVSKEQQDLASLAVTAEQDGDSTITEFDKDPTYIVSESVIKQFILEENNLYQNKLNNNKKDKFKEEFQTIFYIDSQLIEKDKENDDYLNQQQDEILVPQLTVQLSINNNDDEHKLVQIQVDCEVGCCHI